VVVGGSVSVVAQY